MPYFNKLLQFLNIPEPTFANGCRGLVIFDAFAGHLHPETLATLVENQIAWAVVPAGFTDHLQPLDVAGNRAIKCKISAEKDADEIERFQSMLGTDISGMTVNDFRAVAKRRKESFPVLKAGLTKWLVNAHKEISSDKEVLLKGWRKTGLLDVINESIAGVKSEIKIKEPYNANQLSQN